MKRYYTYIITNLKHTVLYTGVTNDLTRRTQEHQSRSGSSFSKRYHLTKLVWFREFSEVVEAIAEEKRIKGDSRADKEHLINEVNPEWGDLADQLW